MPEPLIEDLLLDNRIRAIDVALQIAHINHTAEVQKILADAKKLLSFYEKGPVE